MDSAQESFEVFLSSLTENLRRTSRTAGGVCDTSASIAKPRLTADGEDLAEKTYRNFCRAARFVWQNRQRSFSSPQELRKFVDQVAALVSDGLLQKGQSLYRTWETSYPSTPPFRIEADLQEFCRVLCKALQGEAIVPAELAAWVERKFDATIHPYADGCGRVSKLLAGFVLARFGLPLPQYPPREVYYREIKRSEPEWGEFYRTLLTPAAARTEPGSVRTR